MNECPSCGKPLSGARISCPSCRVLLSNPSAGTLAGRGLRFGAYIVEAVLGYVVILALGALAGISPTEEGAVGTFFLGMLGLIIVNVYFWSKGETLGKRLLGMKVYKTSGSPAGFGTMVLREIVGKFVSGFVLCLGYLWILWDRDFQGWHDKIAGTVVIRKSA